MTGITEDRSEKTKMIQLTENTEPIGKKNNRNDLRDRYVTENNFNRVSKEDLDCSLWRGLNMDIVNNNTALENRRVRSSDPGARHLALYSFGKETNARWI